MMFFCGNDAVLGKEAEVRKVEPQLRPGPEVAEDRREENQPPLFMKEKNVGAGDQRQPVQNLLGGDHRGKERLGERRELKKHETPFFG